MYSLCIVNVLPYYTRLFYNMLITLNITFCLQTRPLHPERRPRGGIQAIIQMRLENHIRVQADIVTKMTIHRYLAESDLSNCRAIIGVTEENNYW